MRLVGDCGIEKFPTFKFYRGAEEDCEPIVGADIAAVTAQLDVMLADA